MSKNQWYDDDNPTKVARGASWRAGIWIIAAVVFFALIGAGFWASRVLFAPVTGRGDAFIQQQSANNRIAAQQRFEDLIADIKASDRKLDQAAADVKARPADTVAATNLSGLRNHCLDTVGNYNAEARKYTAAQFKASDLPAQIDQADPETDCKESTP